MNLADINADIQGVNGALHRLIADFDVWRSSMPAVLNGDQWKALTKAEEPLFKIAYGSHSYTSIVHREEAMLAKLVWDHCEAHMDDELQGTQEGSLQYNMRIARRVARALAVMAFGPEFLLL